MTEEQTPSSSGSATPTPETQPATGTTSGSATPPKSSVTLEEALAQIAELKHAQENSEGELKRHRNKLSAYEKAEKDAADAKKAAEEATLSEIDRITKQHQDALARIQQQQRELVMAQIQLLAKEKGILNHELIAPFVERKLDYDKDGKPTNLEAVLDELIKNNQNLVKPPEPAPSPATSTPASPPTPPAVPAMNPGRSGFGETGKPTGKPTRLEDITWSR